MGQYPTFVEELVSLLDVNESFQSLEKATKAHALERTLT